VATEPLHDRDVEIARWMSKPPSDERKEAILKLLMAQRRWQAPAFFHLCEANFLLFPRYGLVESMAKVENVCGPKVRSPKGFLLPIDRAVHESGPINLPEPVKIRADMLEYFCRYHRAFIRGCYYREYVHPPPALYHSGVDWNGVIGELEQELLEKLGLAEKQPINEHVQAIMDDALASLIWLVDNRTNSRQTTVQLVQLRRVGDNAIDIEWKCIDDIPARKRAVKHRKSNL
jgi:hypothetical protein